MKRVTAEPNENGVLCDLGIEQDRRGYVGYRADSNYVKGIFLAMFVRFKSIS